MCRTFEEAGSCPYAGRCQFAHGAGELRPVQRHPRYKSEVCKTYHTTGVCSYGTRCRFIHGPIDSGVASSSSPINSPRPISGTADDPSATTVAPPLSPVMTTTRAVHSQKKTKDNNIIAAPTSVAGLVLLPPPAVSAVAVASAAITSAATPGSPGVGSPRRLPFFRALVDADDANPLCSTVDKMETLSPMPPASTGSHVRCPSMSSITSLMSLDSGSFLVAPSESK